MTRALSPGASITADQATAFRLRRQGLLARAPKGRLLRSLGAMNGAQAQLLSAAYVSLAARVADLTPPALDRATWERRTLVRAWCMRRTLHLLPARDLAIYARGSTRRAEKEIRWVLNQGVPAPALDRVLAAMLRLLDRPRTRNELASALRTRYGARVFARRGGGWGSARHVPWISLGAVRVPVGYLLHLASARGVYCSGPGRDGEGTFVRADAWIRSWRDRPVAEAERELLRRYLSAFAPSTAADFAIWSGIRTSDATEILGCLGDEVMPVAVAGEPAWALRRDRSELERAALDGPSVRLVPHFDGYLLGHRDHRPLIPSGRLSDVFRPQGWVSPAVLVDGRVEATWSSMPSGGRLDVRVRPLATLDDERRRLIAHEGEELARFFGLSSARTVFDRP